MADPKIEAFIQRAREEGAKQGREHALATDASEIQLMGSYERRHFGLGDFADDLSADIGGSRCGSPRGRSRRTTSTRSIERCGTR